MEEVQQNSGNNIIEKNVTKIKGKTGGKLKKEILKLYPEVLIGLGRLESPYHIQLPGDLTSVIRLPTKILVAHRSRLKKELEEIENAGVIEKVDDPSERLNCHCREATWNIETVP